MKITEFITEAANPAQQAAIAISKKDEMTEGINPNELLGSVYDSKNRYLGTWNGQRLVIDPSVWKKWKDENGQDWASGMVGMAKDRIASGVWTVQQPEGVAEESKYSNLSNRGVNRGINRAADDFDRMMDLDQAESPHYKTQHQQDTKQRLKTKPLAGPKGVLPEQDVAEGYDPVEQDYHDWSQALHPDGDGAKAFNIIRGDANTIRNILGYVKHNRHMLGHEAGDRTGRTIKDAIIDIRQAYPELYQAAQQPQQPQDVEEGENWSKHNNPRAGGMSQKSVNSYRREHPGSKIQTAVTTKPSKLKKGSKSAKRRASFCARMRGMKKHRTGAKTAHDPNSNINKSLRRWHCESIEELHELVMIAEQFIHKRKNESK
jgi:hypothetical protein